MAIDGQTNGPALYYLEYRDPSFACTPDLADCMHGGTELVKQ